MKKGVAKKYSKLSILEALETGMQRFIALANQLPSRAYIKRHNQVAGLIYRNICADYGLEVARSKWEMPTMVVEKDRANLWDFQIQTEKLVVANQPEIVAMNKQSKTAIVIDVSYVAYKNMTECSDSPL